MGNTRLLKLALPIFCSLKISLRQLRPDRVVKLDLYQSGESCETAFYILATLALHSDS